MKTAEEKAEEYADREIPIVYTDEMQTIPLTELRQAARIDYLEGYTEATRCQSSPKIKQLEWDFYGTYYSAETPVIDYIITHENGFIVNEGECALWVNGFPISYGTLDEAKAAAQADFEKRVMECLDIADNSNK